MHILITGASGYIGSNLLDKLIKDDIYDISILIRSSTKSDFVNRYKDLVSIHEYKGFESLNNLMKSKKKVDLVVHLAGYSRSGLTEKEVNANLEGNLLLTAHILEAMRFSGVSQIINTGSYWEFDEKGNNVPNTPYSICKSTSRKLIDYYSKVYNFKFINLIVYDVYGTNDQRNKILSSILKLRDNETFNTTRGEQEISFVYIDDIVAGYINCIKIFQKDIQKYQNKNYHLRDEKSYKLKEVIKKLVLLTNKKIKINFNAILYSPYQIFSLPRNVKILPNWKTEVTLDEGLQKIVENDR
jgi:nucleoside-diphosphate-sugar epimerase